MKGLLIFNFFILAGFCEENRVESIANEMDSAMEIENKEEKNIPEFIEVIDDQVYIDLIGSEDRYILDLLNFHQSLTDGTLDLKEQYGHSCQADILKAFQLKGMKAPLMKDLNVEQCINMTYNCCTLEDMVRIQNQQENQRRATEYNHQYNMLYVREILKNHQKFKKKVEKIQQENEHMICKNTAEKFLNYQVDENTLKEVDDMLIELQKFDLNLKKGSLCFLCDFRNHQHFNQDSNTVFYNVDVCHKIVKETFPTFYYFNKHIWRYINTVNFLAHCYKKNGNGIGLFTLDKNRSFDFLKIDNSLYIEDCNFALENNKKDQRVLVSCLNYCHKYNFFAQGYPIFQDIMLISRIFKNIISSFLPDYVDEIDYPSEQKGFNFEIEDYDKDVFNTYNKVFSQDGIHIEQMMDLVVM